MLGSMAKGFKVKRLWFRAAGQKTSEPEATTVFQLQGQGQRRHGHSQEPGTNTQKCAGSEEK